MTRRIGSISWYSTLSIMRATRITDGFVECVHQHLDQPLLIGFGPSGTEAGGHGDECVGRIAVGDRVVLAARRPGAQRVERSDTGRECGLVERSHQSVDVDVVGHIGGVLDDQMRHCIPLSNMLSIDAT